MSASPAGRSGRQPCSVRPAEGQSRSCALDSSARRPATPNRPAAPACAARRRLATITPTSSARPTAVSDVPVQYRPLHIAEAHRPGPRLEDEGQRQGEAIEQCPRAAPSVAEEAVEQTGQRPDQQPGGRRTTPTPSRRPDRRSRPCSPCRSAGRWRAPSLSSAGPSRRGRAATPPRGSQVAGPEERRTGRHGDARVEHAEDPGS